jgi:hypothetical protein
MKYLSTLSLFFSLFLLSISSVAQTEQIVINEILAANTKINTDEDGDYNDWIELYNTGNENIDLSGFSITDDVTQPQKWIFPTISLSPGEYLFVWASEKDRKSNELHTNFKLQKSGEYIGLYSASSTLIDEIQFGEQEEDASLARLPNGNGTFVKTNQPTPGFSNNSSSEAKIPLLFTPTSGFYVNSVFVTLSTEYSSSIIRYTLDGSSVSTSGRIYSQPIELTSTTVIRAKTFVNDEPVSEDISHIYQLNFDGQLPVLSLATDEENLYGDSGIFDNNTERGDEWEKPVSVNFIDHDGKSFRINSGMRIHGGLTRRRDYPKQSLRLFFRNLYGDSKLKFKVFDSKKVDEFDRLIVHSGGSSDQYYQPWGTNKQWTLLRDPLNHGLLFEENGTVSASKPVILYINGEVWGLYHIRERVDDSYLQSNYFINDADLLRAENDEVGIESGDLDSWNEAYSFFENNSFLGSTNYNKAKELINIANFTDFQIYNIFIGNWDCPHNNIYFFRERSDLAKWNWIMWDTDVSLGSLGGGLPPEMNTLEWATRDEIMPEFAGSGDSDEYLWSTLFLRRLLENEDYKKYFINRFADLMNTTLSPEHIQAAFNNQVNKIENDIHFEIDRWEDASLQDWQNGILSVNDWVEDRSYYQKQHLIEKFGLSSSQELNLNISSGQGHIRVNSKICNELPWKGNYFQDIPIIVEAVPALGFQFLHWDGSLVSNESLLEINLEQDISINATFEEIKPYFQLEFPNGGEQVLSNQKVQIDWSSYQINDKVSIEYSTDNGDHWLSIVEDINNEGFYLWSVPDINSDDCLIRISDSEEWQTNNTSDAVFAIGPPNIEIISPNGGEQFVTGSNQKISWKYRGHSNFVQIKLSTNNGQDWQIIEDEVHNSGEYLWEVPDINSNFCLIKITDESNVVLTDLSNNSFSIKPPPQNMFVTINADDQYDIWINGNYVGSNAVWDTAQTYTVPIFTGSNSIALKGDNRGSSKGLIVEITDGNNVVLVSNSEWKYNNQEIPGWTELSFDDNSWLRVFDFGQYGTAPWGTQIENFPSNSEAHWIWGENDETFLRKNFDFNLEKPGKNVELSPTGIPEEYTLSQNYPNPFSIRFGNNFSMNSVTNIVYSLPKSEVVSITIYDITGRKVKSLLREMATIGNHKTEWNGTDDFGNKVSAGVYFYQMRAGVYQETKKMIIVF